MTKYIYTLIFGIILTSTHIYSDDLISKKVMLLKGMEWFNKNTTLYSPVQYNTKNTIYDKESLFIELLRVIDEEKPKDMAAYKSIFHLIKYQKELALKFKTDILGVVERSLMKEENQNSILDMYEENRFTSTKIETHPSPKKAPPISNVIKSLRDAIYSYKIPKSIKDNLLGSIDTIKNLLLDHLREDDCYDTSTTCQFSKNLGIVRYYSDAVEKNHKLALAVLRSSIRLEHLNERFDLSIIPTFEDSFNIDIWPIFVDAANGDKALALEALSVYGNDNISSLSNTYAENKFLISILEINKPSRFGNDKNPKSSLFLPGVLARKNVSKKVINRLKKAKAFYNKSHKKKLIPIRAGYYHVYGGIMIAQEIHKRGYNYSYGIDIAGFFSHALGYMYKKTQLDRYLTNDAKSLFSSINYNEFNLNKISKKKFLKDWTEQRYQSALSCLHLHLALMKYTEEQHYIGARFALKVYQNL